MVISFYICLFIFVKNLKNVKRSSKINEPIDMSFLYAILLNTCSFWGGIIGFGKPVLPGIVYFGGLLSMVIICRTDHQLTE